MLTDITALSSKLLTSIGAAVVVVVVVVVVVGAGVVGVGVVVAVAGTHHAVTSISLTNQLTVHFPVQLETSQEAVGWLEHASDAGTSHLLIHEMLETAPQHSSLVSRLFSFSKYICTAPQLRDLHSAS